MERFNGISRPPVKVKKKYDARDNLALKILTLNTTMYIYALKKYKLRKLKTNKLKTTLTFNINIFFKNKKTIMFY